MERHGRRDREGTGLTYDPGADAARRYPEWVIRHRAIGVPELLCWRRRVIVIDRGSKPGARRAALAHAVAHLDLGHDRTLPGVYEGREERDAEHLAAQRCIRIADLADVLRWTDVAQEATKILGVDVPMIMFRIHYLRPAERDVLRAAAHSREEVA